MDWTGLGWTGLDLGWEFVRCVSSTFLPHNRVRQGSKIVVGVLIMNKNRTLVFSYATSDDFSE
jgi:hypothetical protein